MNQLIQPNTSVTGTVGLCLQYADKMFGLTHGEKSAWIAWEATQFKHTDPIPSNAVPMWYSYYADLDGTGVKNWGHVTVNIPGVGIYSSPIDPKTTHNVLHSIAEVEQTYGVKYVGWSEDITNLRVVEGEEMEKWNNGDTVNLMVKNGLTQMAADAEATNFVGYFGLQDGMEFKKAMYDIIDSPQWAFAIAAAQAPSDAKVLPPGNYRVQ